MKKIPTLYQRDPENPRRVTDEVTPGCEWVLAGEGVPTAKVDGVCTMFDGERWWARREVKPEKTPPPGWTEVDRDETTGKRVGWVPIEQSGFVKFWREAMANANLRTEEPWRPDPGTYELCGPRINGNPHRFTEHGFFHHTVDQLRLFAYEIGDNISPRDLIAYAASRGWEGVVWHHPDGRRAKLKARDYPDGGADA